ncbi:hypothetical protein D3C80_1606770 [compost metagenome]
MQNGTHTGYPEVQLHVPVTVPGQRADALTRLHSEGGQGVSDLPGAAADVSICAAMDIAFYSARNDFGIRVGNTGVFKQRRNQ